MMESVIGLLTNREAAQRVRSALLEAGCAEKNVVVFDRSAGASLVGELAERGLAPARVDLYAQAVQRGGILVAAEAEKADQLLAVMNRFELTAPENVPEEHVERAQSVEEELKVGKQTTTGGKRLVTSVTEREVEKLVTLHEEEVVLRREEITVDHIADPDGAGRDDVA